MALMCVAVGALLGGARGVAHPHGRASSPPAPPRAPPQGTKVVQARDMTPGEPTCDELKAMWRFSKRQARAPEIINELPSYQDPFAVNEWGPYYAVPAPPTPRIIYARPTSPTAVFGRVVHKAPLGRAPIHGYERVAQLYGTLAEPSPRRAGGGTLRYSGRRLTHMPSQAGRFQHLKQLIQTERARELHAQRVAEQLAARAAAIKEMTQGGRGKGRGRHPGSEFDIYQERDYPLADEAQDSSDSYEAPYSQEGIIKFPNILAPGTYAARDRKSDYPAAYVPDQNNYDPDIREDLPDFASFSDYLGSFGRTNVGGGLSDNRNVYQARY